MGNFECSSADAEQELTTGGYYAEEPSDTEISRQVRVVRDELTRLAEWSWYGLGGDMTLALRESLRDNSATWADDTARRITRFLTEYRLRQLGLDGDEEKCGGWSAYDDAGPWEDED